MKTYYEEYDMIDFARYILSKEREDSLKQLEIEFPDAIPYEERKLQVYHADFENWKEKRKTYLYFGRENEK